MSNPKKTKNKKPLLYPVVFMVCLSAIFTGILATLNAFTIDRIETLEEIKNQTSLLYVFNQPVPIEISEIQEAYTALITEKSLSTGRVYVARQGDEVIGYAFPFSGSGLWGTVWGYIALSPDLTEVLGVDFIKHAETPGLGGRISEPWYRDQFRGIDTSGEGTAWIVYRPTDGGNVDAITGATLTSQAVRNMLNDAIADIKDNMKGEF